MTKKTGADLLLLVITIIWGASFPLMKIILDYIPAFAYISMRFLTAAAVLAVIFRKNLARLNRKVLLHGGIIGIFMLGGTAFQVVGLYTTTASNSGFITGLNVVMVPLISAVLFKRKPDRTSFIGVVVAFAGLFFLSGGLDFNFSPGDFFTFLCAVCWAFQITFIDRFTQADDASLLAFTQVLFVGVAGSGLWLVSDAGKPFAFNGTAASIILITAVFGTALAFGGQTAAQKYTTPTHTALIFAAEPVFALIFAMIIPDTGGMTETLMPAKAAGCLLILAGMLVSELKPGRASHGRDAGRNAGRDAGRNAGRDAGRDTGRNGC